VRGHEIGQVAVVPCIGVEVLDPAADLAVVGLQCVGLPHGRSGRARPSLALMDQGLEQMPLRGRPHDLLECADVLQHAVQGLRGQDLDESLQDAAAAVRDLLLFEPWIHRCADQGGSPLGLACSHAGQGGRGIDRGVVGQVLQEVFGQGQPQQGCGAVLVYGDGLAVPLGRRLGLEQPDKGLCLRVCPGPVHVPEQVPEEPLALWLGLGLYGLGEQDRAPIGVHVTQALP